MKTAISCLLLFLCLILYPNNQLAEHVKFSLEAVVDMPIVLSEGKRQFEALSAKTSLYGSCWDRAVSELTVGCKSLTEDLQSSLALRFTDCFLQKAGHDPILCSSPRQDCLRQLPDRAFNAYTEFYTHTQSICYYLQSKTWHLEAERTIDRLSSTSLKVSYQLAETEKSQEALLQQQKESITLQENLAAHMETSKESILQFMEDLQSSTLEQKTALLSIFDKLSSLQTWMVGEVSWLESLFFYATACFLTFLFTSAPATQRARLPLFLLLSVNYLIERYLAYTIDNHTESIFMFTENLVSWIWWVRKGTIASCVFVICVAAATHCDYDTVNNQLLIKIKKQNDIILKKINPETESSYWFCAQQNRDSVDAYFTNEIDVIPSKSNESIQSPNSLESETPLNTGRNDVDVASVHKSRHEWRRDGSDSIVDSDSGHQRRTPKTLRRSTRLQKHCDV